jgi:hypothetical protein
MGTFRPAKSKYYAGQVLDPASGTHYDSDTGRPTAAPPRPPEAKLVQKLPDEEVEAEGPSVWVSVGKFALVYAVLLAFGLVLAHQAGPGPRAGTLGPGALIALCGVQFLAGLLMPVMRAVPWQDEDSDDVLTFIILTFVFGPIISIVIYCIVALMRQDANPAVAGLMLVAAVTRFGVEIAAGTLTGMRVMPWLGSFSIPILLINWTGLLGLIGWYMANLFHKLDE